MTDAALQASVLDSEEKRIYMRAVRDESGELVGYYERYERNAA
ncbi:MAG: hypothetical protein ABIE42_06630 [Candidatus Eisenbacteria bacterium]